MRVMAAPVISVSECWMRAEAHIQWAFITLMTRRLTRRNRRTEAAPTSLATAA
jgi:hypothetical protein